MGIISGSIWGSFQGWRSFRGRDHFGGCTGLFWAPNELNELPEVAFEFLFNLIWQTGDAFLNRPIIARTQLEAQNVRTLGTRLLRRRT